MRNKKLSYNDPELLKKIVQRELDLYNITYDYVNSLPNGKLPNGDFWFQHYTFNSLEQEKDWENFAITEIRNCKERPSIRESKKIFEWISMRYGLKRNF